MSLVSFVFIVEFHINKIYVFGANTIDESMFCQLWHSFYSSMHTQRNLFEISLNQAEIKLYLPFLNSFEAKRTSIWFQINRKIVNTIWFRLDLIRFRKKNQCVRDIWIPTKWGELIFSPKIMLREFIFLHILEGRNIYKYIFL